MKKVQSGLLGAIVGISLCVKADDSGDIEVVIPDMPPPRVMSKEEADARKAYEALGLPIRSAAYYTMGEVCRGSHLIVVGRIEAAQSREVDFPGFLGKTLPTIDLTVRVSETLLGDAQGGKVSFTFGFPFHPYTVFPRPPPPARPPGEDPRIYTPEKPPSPDTWIGMEILALLRPLSPHNSKNLGRMKTMKIKTVSFEPTWEKKSVFVLTDGTRDEILDRVRGYIRWQSSKDVDIYKAFLSEQMKSTDWRISGDAAWDMIDFMRSHYTDKEELKKASQDPLLDKRVRGHFEFLRIMEAIPKE